VKRRRPSPKVLPHYPHVIAFVHLLRYATKEHVFRHFRQHIHSMETCEYQLRALTTLKFLARINVRHRAKCDPYIYQATAKGVRFVHAAWAAQVTTHTLPTADPQRGRGLSPLTAAHELAISDLQAALWEGAAAHGNSKLSEWQRRFHRHKLIFTHAGQRHSIEPDLAFLLQQPGRAPIWHVVEVDRGTAPLARIRAKLLDYHRWIRSHDAGAYLAAIAATAGLAQLTALRLLYVATDHRERHDDRHRLRELLDVALTVPKDTRDRLWLAATSDLYSQPPLAPAWLLARRARQYRFDTQDLFAHPYARSPVSARRFIQTHDVSL
jgi:hypothetical protein